MELPARGAMRKVETITGLLWNTHSTKQTIKQKRVEYTVNTTQHHFSSHSASEIVLFNRLWLPLEGVLPFLHFRHGNEVVQQFRVVCLELFHLAAQFAYTSALPSSHARSDRTIREYSDIARNQQEGTGIQMISANRWDPSSSH